MEFLGSNSIEIISWSGSISLVLAGAFIDRVEGKALQILGILCLLAQSVFLGHPNLVALNVCTLATFFYSFVRQIRGSKQFRLPLKYHGKVYCARDLVLEV